MWDGCIMGYPLGDDETCGKPTVSDRPADIGYLWCAEHMPGAEPPSASEDS